MGANPAAVAAAAPYVPPQVDHSRHIIPGSELAGLHAHAHGSADSPCGEYDLNKICIERIIKTKNT